MSHSRYTVGGGLHVQAVAVKYCSGRRLSVDNTLRYWNARLSFFSDDLSDLAIAAGFEYCGSVKSVVLSPSANKYS